MSHVAPIATPVQAIPGKINPQRQPPSMQVRIQSQIGALQVDTGALPACCLDLIDHTILDDLGTEASMANLLTATVKIHRQGGSRAQVSRPFHAGNRIAQCFGLLNPFFA